MPFMCYNNFILEQKGVAPLLDALLAILILFVANLLITLSRTRLKGWVRRVTSFFAFLLLIPAFLLILKVVMFM